MLPLLVTAAIIHHDGKILIARRKADAPYPLLWEFPGGKVEKNEDPRICVVRELKEELDIAIEVESIYDVVYYRYPEKPVLVLAYRCRWIGGSVKDLDVTEHRWVLPEHLEQFDFLPADLPLIQRLNREPGA
jgi:8-oxo-dGTP diphosphatase